MKALTHYLTTDLGGITRGRGLWGEVDDAPKASVGWVPVNQVISPFDTIPANPYGSHGDCRLWADPATLTRVPLPDGEDMRLVLCDVGSLDGTQFDVCARTFLKRQIAALAAQGIRVLASFEQEFWLDLPEAGAATPGFSFQRAQRHEPFGTSLMEALEAAGVEPEMLLPEFAQGQFELTLKPSWGTQSADRAVIVREIVKIMAHRAGGAASFVPLKVPGGVGSGVHVHLSLWNEAGEPLLYDAAGRGGLSALGERFCAGLVAHMPALCALSAPAVVSYERLQPHRWSSAYTCMGDRNREATLRICPVVGAPGTDVSGQFNVEYRAADATANPWLVLGGLLAAGLEGLSADLPPPPLVNSDPSELPVEELAGMGVRRLPGSLGEALDAFEADPRAATWLGAPLHEAYLLEKRHEIEACAGLSPEQVCAAYAAVF